MAVNFGLLQPAQPVSAFFQGQQDVRAEADRNMLRQQQAEKLQFERENMLAQRGEREALAAQRRAQDARAAQRQQFLTGAAEALAQGGATLDRPTLMKVLQSGVQADEPTLIQFAREGLKALDEDDLYRQEATRFGLPGGAPAAAPGAAAAPVNALAAPPAAPSVTRESVQAMLTSPSARIREQGKALVQTLEKPQTYTPSADMQGYELAKSEGFKGTFFDYKRQLAEAGRTPPAPREPREPPAPTVTQIQDPADPSRMLTIDARRYAGGSVGAPGVIGTSGKTAPAAAAEQKKVAAQNELQNVIDTLKTAYADLDAMRAVPSEQRNVISNALSYIASTGPGQVAGRIGGTAAQTQRDVIQSSRNLLFTAVKNATGKTSGELNSNVEFKTWLEALTDPSRSIQANQAILENLEKFVASGGNYSARKSAGEVKPAPGVPPRAPAAGASPYQNLSNEELLRQLGVKPGGR